VARRAVVVGAGAIGIASAYYLQRSGWSVTVVDRGEVGHGCSYGNSCLIVPSHSDPIPGPGVMGQALRFMLSRTSPFYVRPRLDASLVSWSWKFRSYCTEEARERGFAALLALSRGSLALYEQLTAAKEAEFLFERRGLLEVFLTESGVEASRRDRDRLSSHGFSATALSREDVLSFEENLSPAVRGGLFISTEAHGFSYGYVQALARTVASRGGRISSGRPVARLLAANGRVTGLALDGPREELEADVVVLAAGAWSRSLAAGLALDIPLQPAKGYTSTVDSFEGVPAVPVLVKERRVVVTPLGERVRFGGTLELAGFDSTIDRKRYQAVVRGAKEVLKRSFPMKNEEAWCGLRPVTPDGLPVIDQPREGLIVATGHAMLGFTQSPMTGKVVAEIAGGETPSVPLEPFRLDRFRRAGAGSRRSRS
jgi:D-amino-acid dehydrogenase